MRSHSSRQALCGLYLLVLVAVITAGCTRLPWSESSRSTIEWIPLPVSVAELVRVSDVIARGTVVEIVDGGRMHVGPTVVAPTGTRGDGASNAMPLPNRDIPLTYSQVRIDEMLYANPQLDLAAGSVVTLISAIDLPSYVTPTPARPLFAWGDAKYRLRLNPPLEQVGDERLFFLTLEGADSLEGTFGTAFGAYSALDLAGDEVRLSSSPPIVIDITENRAVPDFLSELESILAAQRAP